MKNEKLTRKEKFETLKDSIIEEIGELPLSINIVAREQELIRQAQNNLFGEQSPKKSLMN